MSTNKAQCRTRKGLFYNNIKTCVSQQIACMCISLLIAFAVGIQVSTSIHNETNLHIVAIVAFAYSITQPSSRNDKVKDLGSNPSSGEIESPLICPTLWPNTEP